MNYKVNADLHCYIMQIHFHQSQILRQTFGIYQKQPRGPSLPLTRTQRDVL